MPVIEEISGEMTNVSVKKVNIDQNPESPQKYGVRGIPTLMIFKDGKVIGTKVGALPKSKLVEWINSVVAA
jgi:thioredoxin 1